MSLSNRPNGDTSKAFKAANTQKPAQAAPKNQTKENKFNSFRPAMDGPKPPGWVQNSVNRSIHAEQQAALAKREKLRNDLKHDFHNSARKTTKQTQVQGKSKGRGGR